jgi:hypothetical protein
MKKFIIFIVVVSLFSCNSSKQTYNAANMTIKMEKTPCYGFCPVYNLTIEGNGIGTYIGKKNVKKIGTYKFNFSSAQIDSLVKEFEDINFWDLADKYEAKITDLPTTYITFSLNGRTKRIKDYFGSPQSLKNLEEKLDRLSNDLNWIKVK